MPAAVPVATYRVQFTPEFGFDQAAGVAGYLADLGAGALYASPIWEARRGSRHGYDVTDPGRVRDGLGSEEAFLRLARELRERRLGLLLDIVPNHMAASTENAWWSDVLEHGPISPFARFFDIDWESGPGGKLVLPVLGRPVDEAVDAGEVSLCFDGSRLVTRYFEQRWPLNVRSYALALASLADGQECPEREEVATLLQDTAGLPAWHSRGAAGDSNRLAAALQLKRRWADLFSRQPPERAVPALDREQLRGVLAGQAYSLEYWREGIARINYRRFFDIAGLVALRVEDPEVFEAVHRLPLRLMADGLATGLRIDHIDGLRDPAGYLERLAERVVGEGASGRAGGPACVVVEKILGPDEEIPATWPVDGTTGYEYLNALNGVFVDPAGVAGIHEAYGDVTGDRRSFEEVATAEKLAALRELFAAEAARLAADLARLAAKMPDASGVTRDQLQEALVQVSAALPVYRTYIRDGDLSQQDALQIRRALEQSFETARRRGNGASVAALSALRVVESVLTASEAQVDEAARLDFVMRWQQLTGPAMAKGVEDTAMFSYTPFVSLNEVGGDPSGRHCSVGFFHALNSRRARVLPHSLNATSTHDTKRSEDVRARLNAISELAPEWSERVAQWRAINAPSKKVVGGLDAPSPADELLFYQSLAGIWPLEGRLDGVEARICAFMVKASREAKKRSSWVSPDEAYESALTRFVGDVLHGARSGEFAASFLPFQQRIAFAGAVNSLSQVVLKAASPGVPDFYQGSEMWDFSLTDPDNRRPTAFDRRALELSHLLERMPRDRSLLCNDLLGNWRDGRVKLFTTAQSLRTRAAVREAFVDGDYLPVEAEGERAAHVCAFLRSSASSWVLAVAPRLVSRLNPAGQWPLGGTTWEETDLVLPSGAPVLWGNAFTGAVVQADPETRRLPIALVLAEFPVALLRGV
ncbi:MAG: malto-oligosyltrehalose synthase [Chloroflexi bacterium]|nr:malto-oligosyltrehalose synthase [Chloroflexota bacterium]